MINMIKTAAKIAYLPERKGKIRSVITGCMAPQTTVFNHVVVLGYGIPQ